MDMMSVIKKPSDAGLKQVFIPLDKLKQSEINQKVYIVDDCLKDSIVDVGLMQPLTVVKLDDGTYEITSGNRRYKSMKSLVKKNPLFKYKWQGDENNLVDPIRVGLPCNIANIKDDSDKLVKIIVSNKARVLDNLEQYRSVIELEKVYKELKKSREIAHGDGSKREWIANIANVSARTVTNILADEWLVNSKNVSKIEEAGSYSKWNENRKFNNKSSKQKIDPCRRDREIKKLQGIKKYYSNFKEGSLNLNDFTKVRSEGIDTVIEIMNALGINANALAKMVEEIKNKK